MTMIKNQIDRHEKVTIRFLGDNMTLERDQWVELIDLMAPGEQRDRLMQRIIDLIPEDVLLAAFADGAEASMEVGAEARLCGNVPIREAATKAGNQAAAARVKLPVSWVPMVFGMEE